MSEQTGDDENSEAVEEGAESPEAGEISASDDSEAVGDELPETREDAERPPWTPERLHRLRRDSTERRVALVVAGLVGLGLVWLHWLGLFAAGALVGLVSRDLPRALAAGLGFGLLVLVVHVLAAPEMGFGAFLGLTPISYVTIGAALVAPVWGALVRGVL